MCLNLRNTFVRRHGKGYQLSAVAYRFSLRYSWFDRRFATTVLLPVPVKTPFGGNRPSPNPFWLSPWRISSVLRHKKDTRNALHGPFWENYVDSIENLHDFNDGDGFVTSYPIHAMEGAFPSFIERENDPKYRNVVFRKLTALLD